MEHLTREREREREKREIEREERERERATVVCMTIITSVTILGCRESMLVSAMTFWRDVTLIYPSSMPGRHRSRVTNSP